MSLSILAVFFTQPVVRRRGAAVWRRFRSSFTSSTAGGSRPSPGRRWISCCGRCGKIAAGCSSSNGCCWRRAACCWCCWAWRSPGRWDARTAALAALGRADRACMSSSSTTAIRWRTRPIAPARQDASRSGQANRRGAARSNPVPAGVAVAVITAAPSGAADHRQARLRPPGRQGGH